MAFVTKAGMSSYAMQPKTVALRSSFLPAQASSLSSISSARGRNMAFVSTRKVAANATSGGDVDFDKVLSDIADKFEKSDKKAAVVAYSAAAIGALWFSEWLIHLPLLNYLLGFPIQLLGLTLLPYFSVKYLVDKDNVSDDAGKAFDRVVKKLPGFDK